jgi:hypothetical protein
MTGAFTLYRVDGLFADIRSGFDAFQRPQIETYPICQRLARALASEGRVDGIVYRSAREAGGTCVAVWPREKCAKVKEGRTARLVWDGETLC